MINSHLRFSEKLTIYELGEYPFFEDFNSLIDIIKLEEANDAPVRCSQYRWWNVNTAKSLEAMFMKL